MSLRAVSDAGPARTGVVVYDYLLVPGGAENVTLEMARGLPGAALCVGLRHKTLFPDALLTGLPLHDLGHGDHGALWRLLAGVRAFRQRAAFLADYDWAIFSGVSAPLAAPRFRPQGNNILYCHTIPRFIYDLREYYLESLPFWQRPALRGLIAYLQPRYEEAFAHMDLVVANSENVRQRIKRYLGKDSVVIHPPSEVERYAWLGQSDYYLSTARLEPYKRVEVLIRAFLRMPDKKLVVASGGSDEARLRRLAAGAANIQFTGWVTKEEMAHWVGQALATLYLPKDEDFGLSPVESMAAGKPVIGVAEGGVLETVLPGQTGWLLDPNALEEGVLATVRGLSPEQALAMRPACEERAQQFTRVPFLQQLSQLVNRLP